LLNKEKVLVLDSSAFIMGLEPLQLDLKLFTTPEVVEELSSYWVQLKYSTAIYLKKLNVVSPTKDFLDEAKKVSEKTGDKLKLSRADLSILALALELKSKGFKPIIISDDFSVQNVAEHLKIDYTYLSGKGIKNQIEWIWYCPGCGRKFLSINFGENCPVCGLKLKRKASKKISLRKNFG